MKRTLTQEDKDTIAQEIKQFLAEEFEMDVSAIRDDASIVGDLGGDSILFLEMIDEFSQKFDFKVEARIIAQYMMKKRISTVGETIAAVYEIAEKGEDLIAEVEAR